MTIAQLLLQEFHQEAEATRRVLSRVPPHQLSWRPHEKSRTLGELALHIAAVPGVVDGMMHADTFEATSASPSPREPGDILETFEGGAANLARSIQDMTDGLVSVPVAFTANGRTLFSMPRAAILRTILLNHSYHHRGQLTVYLRLLGVPVPSVYGPTADDNPFGQ